MGPDRARNRLLQELSVAASDDDRPAAELALRKTERTSNARTTTRSDRRRAIAQTSDAHARPHAKRCACSTNWYGRHIPQRHGGNLERDRDSAHTTASWARDGYGARVESTTRTTKTAE